MSNDKPLKVAELKPGEAGKGVARIDPELMGILGINVGDIVQINGTKKTVVKVLMGGPEDANRGIIRIDGSTRRNAGTGIDERVGIKKIEAKNATKITFAPSQELRLQGGEDFLRDMFVGRTFAKGDTITLSVMGNKFDMIVTSFTPSADAATITPNTQVKINDKPAGSNGEIPTVTYDDIGGLGDEVKKIREMVELPLRHPELFKRLGVDAPKGVLLHGPPGTGKTMLAKAVATESEANFIAVKGPEFLNKWVGESEKAVRETFRKARQASPCVIFMDEIDSITPERGTGSDSNVTERVISQMLTEMDGLEALNNVVVIAATNRPDIMDPALLRPGRFDKSIYIGPPDQVSREKIFKIHTAKKPLDADVDLSKIAEMTEGCTGADISAICNEAVMCAVRELVRNSKDPNAVNADECKVHMKDFEKAVEKFGPKAREKLKEYNH